MTPSPHPTVLACLVALLILSAALAGCHDFQGDSANGTPSDDDDGGVGDDDDDGSADGDDDTSPPPPPPDDDDGNGDGNGNGATRLALTLTPQDPPAQKIDGEASSLIVNVSGDTAQATSAGIRWSTTSTAGTDAESLTTSQFSHSKAAVGSNHGFPGEYSVTAWTLQTGTYYVRAHTVVDGLHYWSDEFTVQVVPEIEEGSFSAQQITISTSITAPCSGDTYSPAEMTINVGEAVKWHNSAACAHTATSGASVGDPDGKFDTGSLGTNGGESVSYRFNKAGTYTYYCAFHGGMPLSKIVVNA